MTTSDEVKHEFSGFEKATGSLRLFSALVGTGEPNVPVVPEKVSASTPFTHIFTFT